MSNAVNRISHIVALMFVVMVTEVFAGTSAPHLLPENGYFGYSELKPYFESVSERLLSPVLYRKCQVVFLPSFSQENAVYLKYDDDDKNEEPIVVSSKFERQLWVEMQILLESAAGKKTYTAGVADQRKIIPQLEIAVNHLEAPINAEVAIVLERVWNAMLSDVHYPEKICSGLDGETYHFANYTLGVGYLTGQVWSPNKGTPSYELVEIAKALRDYPSLQEDKRQHAAQAMLKRAQRLLVRIKNNK